MIFVKRTILIAGIGTSPAILTGTIWCLAHQEMPIVPDEIVAITTRSGKHCLLESVLSGNPSVWTLLLNELERQGLSTRDKLMFGGTSIRVIPDARGNEIDDLRTGDDNLRAADFMLRQIRQYTEDQGTVVLASIAGGRKTMSALLFSCMSLLGREEDKVFHLLLPPEFEGGIEPLMYFPKKDVTYVNQRTGKEYKGDKIHNELFEVPYVRMRGWYQEKFKTIPPSYRALISKIQTVVPPAIAYPEIEIDAWNGWVTMDGMQVPMSRPCFAMLLLLSSGVDPRECHHRLVAAHNMRGTAKCDWLASFQEGPLFRNESDSEDVYKTMSNLRGKLKRAGFVDVESLIPRRGNVVMFPLSRIKWRNTRKLADVCGCLFSTTDE